jgi:hypothetical protein
MELTTILPSRGEPYLNTQELIINVFCKGGSSFFVLRKALGREFLSGK